MKLTSLFLSLSLFGSLLAEEVTPTPAKPKIERLNENEYRIGKVHLNRTTNEISFPAELRMREGLVEFLLTTEMSNKTHETVFVTDVSPFNLSVAMKLLGITESKEIFQIIDEESRLLTEKFYQVSPEVSTAARVDIFVEWEIDGEKKRHSANELVEYLVWKEEAGAGQSTGKPDEDQVEASPMPAGPWLSTGSYLDEGHLVAELDGLFFSIFTSRQALVTFLGQDRSRDDVWQPNDKVLPPWDTDLIFILKPHSQSK